MKLDFGGRIGIGRERSYSGLAYFGTMVVDI